MNGSPIVLNVTRGTFLLVSSLLRGPLGLDSLGASLETFGLDCNTAVTIPSGGHSTCGAESTSGAESTCGVGSLSGVDAISFAKLGSEEYLAPSDCKTTVGPASCGNSTCDVDSLSGVNAISAVDSASVAVDVLPNENIAPLDCNTTAGSASGGNSTCGAESTCNVDSLSGVDAISAVKLGSVVAEYLAQ